MAPSLQDAYLTECRDRGTPIAVRLSDGSTVRGIVKGFDSFTISLEQDGATHLLYKHAVALISP